MRFEAAVAALGAGNDGIVCTADLVEAGLSIRGLENLRRRGVLQPVGRGVDKLRDHPWTWRARARATLALAGPGSLLARRAAARLHGFYRYRDCDEVEAVVRRGRDHRAAVGRIIESRWLPPEHATVVDGLPVTTVARTFFDLCGNPDGGRRVADLGHRRRMIAVYNDAVGRRGLSFTQEAAVLTVLARRGRNGTQLVRGILEELGPRYQPTMSDTETLFLEVVRAAGLAEPEKQVPISDRAGWIGNVDFLWREARHVVEVDSSWHDGPVDQLEDELRDERLRAAGYTVARYRYGRLVLDTTAVQRELAAAIRTSVR